MGKPGDPLTMMQRQQASGQRESAADREEAFKQGVMETSRLPVIFVDPDNIHEIDLRFSHRPPYTRNPGYNLERQLERQVPGSSQGLQDRVNEGELDQKTMNEIAREIKKAGPAAMNKIMVNGQEYGLVIMPNRNFDTKAEIVDDMFDHLDRDQRRAILQNTPGTDSQWMRMIGNHEGEHLNDPVDQKGIQAVLSEEVRADRSARDRALSRGEGDVALAFKDFRALRAWGDPGHASSPLMLSSDNVSYMHALSASDVSFSMDRYVRANFDWKGYSGKAKTPEDLLKESPEAYFDAARKGMEAENAKVMAKYKADPDNIDTQRAAIFAQVRTDYQNDFEDAYRRRILGQNVPERAPTQLVSQEVEDRFFPEEKFQLRKAVEQSRVSDEAFAAYPDERVFEGEDFLNNPPNVTDAMNAEYARNPLEYLQALNERFDTLKDQAVKDFAADPSYENRERLVQLEIVMNQARKDLVIEQIKVDPTKGMGDYKDPEPVKLLSDADRRSYYEERFARQDAGTWVKPEAYKAPPAPEPPPTPLFDLPGVVAGEDSEVLAEATVEFSDEIVLKGADWDKIPGNATNSIELLLEDSQLYYKELGGRLDGLKDKILTDYKANPSFENLDKVVKIEAMINQNNVMSAFQEVVNSTDPSVVYEDPKPVSLISEAERAGYYQERMQRKAAAEAAPVGAEPAKVAPPEKKAEGAGAEAPVKEAPVQEAPKSEGGGAGAGADTKNYKQGVDGTAYTTVVSGLQGGTPLVDFEAESNRITVGGLSMASLFAQAADPAPESISLVNARAVLPEVESDFVSPQIQANRSVSLGAPA